MFERLKQLETCISTVRKTQIPTWFHNIQYPEEIAIIKQAKREYLPVFAELCGKALLDKDEDLFWQAIEDGTIDTISPAVGLEMFLQESIQQFRITQERVNKLLITIF